MYLAMSWISGSYSRGTATTAPELVLLTVGVVEKVAIVGSTFLREERCTGLAAA